MGQQGEAGGHRRGEPLTRRRGVPTAIPGLDARVGKFPGASSLFWPMAGIVLALAAHLYLALTRAINWDEFYHYSQVQKLAQGTLTEPLQTLYTRAFVWVVDLPGVGVDHIIMIRIFMLLCEIIVAAAIFGAASRFVARVPAMLCALAYLTAGHVLQHGTSFRFDAPAAAMLMTAAWILLRFRLTTGPNSCRRPACGPVGDADDQDDPLCTGVSGPCLPPLVGVGRQAASAPSGRCAWRSRPRRIRAGLSRARQQPGRQ